MSARRISRNVIAEDSLAELRAEMRRLEAQRGCMRIPDRYWQVMKHNAQKSPRPLVTALESELERHAKLTQQQFGAPSCKTS